MGRGALALAAILIVALAAPAASDDARTKLGAALEKTGQAKSARVAATQKVAWPDRSLETRAWAELVAGDSDLKVEGDGGSRRRVAVGTTVYERTPDVPGAQWRTSERPAPSQTNAFGPLTLPDGRRISDPTLYRAVVSETYETLPQGSAVKLVVEVDMAALGTALRLGSSEQARMAQMQGTLIAWIADGDGRLVRQSFAIVIPSDSGSATQETTVDLADLDAALQVTPP